MRKLLLILVIVLLLVLGVNAATKGVQIGNFRIHSVEEIGQKSQELDGKVQEINTLIDSNYPLKIDELNKTSKNMQEAKLKYLNEINEITNEELESTLKVKNFDIEKIWTVVGNHAIDEGVNITLSISERSTTGARNLHFEVKGTYVAQTNFLYSLGNDEELGYRIYNYKLVPFDHNILKATFAIKETIITKSLNDDINGLEYVDPNIKDAIFTQQDKINGKATSSDSINENSTSSQDQNNQNTTSGETTTSQQNNTVNTNTGDTNTTNTEGTNPTNQT